MMKGYFKPNDPNKYVGDLDDIVYRSSWELAVMRYLDSNSSVIQWASEWPVIPYRSIVTGRKHRYFPDFWVKKIGQDGTKSIVIIEVKPHYQTVEPKKSNKLTKRYLTEVKTWATNTSKWSAAREYCADRGWEFQILTEYDLGIKR